MQKMTKNDLKPLRNFHGVQLFLLPLHFLLEPSNSNRTSSLGEALASDNCLYGKGTNVALLSTNIIFEVVKKSYMLNFWSVSTRLYFLCLAYQLNPDLKGERSIRSKLGSKSRIQDRSQDLSRVYYKNHQGSVRCVPHHKGPVRCVPPPNKSPLEKRNIPKFD